jgi:hypothetical protein
LREFIDPQEHTLAKVNPDDVGNFGTSSRDFGSPYEAFKVLRHPITWESIGWGKPSLDRRCGRSSAHKID